MALNTANEIDAVRLHMLAAQHALANSATVITLAVDEWDTLPERQKARFQAYWIDTLEQVAAEIAAARSIVRIPGGRR